MISIIILNLFGENIGEEIGEEAGEDFWLSNISRSRGPLGEW